MIPKLGTTHRKGFLMLYPQPTPEDAEIVVMSLPNAGGHCHELGRLTGWAMACAYIDKLAASADVRVRPQPRQAPGQIAA